MVISEEEKKIFGEDAELLSKEGDKSVFRVYNDDGDMEMTAYEVFPGIELIYRTAHIKKYTDDNEIPGDVFEIDHCREGRIEYEYTGEFYYLAPGDMAIHKRRGVRESYYPQGHYHGISIVVDMEKAPQNLSAFLDDADVRPHDVLERFCSENDHFIARSDEGIEHIFSELYRVPDSIKDGYLKVKILELFLFLSAMKTEKTPAPKRSLTKSQVNLAQKVCGYLIERMDERVTLEQLTEVFHLSGTQIKTTFKGVYGISIYAYIRQQKMQAAAKRLRESDETILEIAGRYGYENGSKFAKAFKDTIGITPNEYRNADEETIKALR